jgi:imidazole glycerol-phosphate synthase subunit HisH
VIVVVDYGVNNLKSVVRGLTAGGHASLLTTDPDEVRRADHILMPGVGNFGQAARTLASTGLGSAVREAAGRGTPVMGICLGLQLFFATSAEAPDVEGLGLLPGTVVRFDTALPVPHVGWAQVELTSAGRRHAMLNRLFDGGPQFYYHVHSYHPAELPEHQVLATGTYDHAFPALVGGDNVVGAQFHPEKSQGAGIALLDAFARWRP